MKFFFAKLQIPVIIGARFRMSLVPNFFESEEGIVSNPTPLGGGLKKLLLTSLSLN